MTRHSLGYLLSERAQKQHAQKKFAALTPTPAVQSQSDEAKVKSTTFFEIQSPAEEYKDSQETPITTENVSAEVPLTFPNLVPEGEEPIKSTTLDQSNNLLHPEHKTAQ